MSKIPNPKYKCTYTSLEGLRCPVMGKYKRPHPSHCHAYDTTIWDINPEMTCANCILMKREEIPKEKIWCDQMDICDSYNDGGSERCEKCPAGIVVFDLPKRKAKKIMGKQKNKVKPAILKTVMIQTVSDLHDADALSVEIERYMRETGNAIVVMWGKS